MRAVIVGGLLATLLDAVDAQTPERALPATVPTGLALALTDDLFGRRWEPGRDRVLPFVMGAAPEGFPSELVPQGSRIVAGLDQSQQGVIVAIAGDTAEARATVTRSLRAKGWTSMPEDSSRGGFVATSSIGFMNRFLCRGDEGLSIRTTAIPAALERAPNGGPITYVTLTHLRENAPCGDRLASSRRMSGMSRGIRFPTMRAPVGATSSGGGSSRSDNTSSTSTDLNTEMPLRDLATHYRGEIERGGWTVGEVAQAQGVAMVALRAKDTEGRDWGGALVVADVGPNARHVTVTMARANGRP